MAVAALSLQSLSSLAHVLAQDDRLEDVLETAAELACEALSGASVSIGRYEQELNRVRTIVNVGDLSDDEVRWPDAEYYPLTEYQRLVSAIHEHRSSSDSITDPHCDPRERALLERLGKGSSLVTAILVDGQSWGEFFVTRHVDVPMFDADAIAYAEVVAAIVGAAVSRTMREQELQHLAFHDALTGLLNRRGLDARAAEAFDLTGVGSRAVAAVAIDIDGLKRVNDTEGHAKGDQVIRRTAAALSYACEPLASSAVARVGGDEFTILVAGDDVDDIERRVNEMCLHMAARSSRIDLSVGIASAVLIDGSTLTPSELFASADRAQYVAKRTRAEAAVIADDLTA